MVQPHQHRRAVLLAAILTAAGFAFSLAVFYPGYMTNDAGFVYQFAKDGRYGDWQSPLMSMLWRMIDPVAPGPGSMFLLIVVLYWLGFGLIAIALARRSAILGIAAPILALVPPAFMLLGMIWRDVLFGAVWLSAAGLSFIATDRGTSVRRLMQALAFVLIAFGVLLRPNAIVAAPLLAAYALWPARFDLKRGAIVFLPGIACGFALVHLVYYGVLDVKREHPLHSLMVFDLGGITHFTGENQFPVAWSTAETALLTSKCYDPDRWDTYWTMQPCRFVMQRLERPDDRVFGTARLSDAWRRAVLAHPLAYLRHRAAYAWRLFTGPILTLELYHAKDPARTPLAQRRAFQMLVALHDRLKPTPLFRVWFWFLLAGVVLALGLPARAGPSGAFAVGVTLSGIAYVLTFVPFGVAAEFRYAYWAVLATLAGGAAVLAARSERLKPAVAAAGPLA